MNPLVPEAGGSASARLADPQQLFGQVCAIMDALQPVLEEETALVRAGRLADAATLHTRKAELASGYLAASQLFKTLAAHRPGAAGEMVGALGERHGRLRSALQTNMTVLATVHAVAEDIVRGAAAALSRRNAPQAYGCGGRPSEPPAHRAGPLVVNRSC